MERRAVVGFVFAGGRIPIPVPRRALCPYPAPLTPLGGADYCLADNAGGSPLATRLMIGSKFIRALTTDCSQSRSNFLLGHQKQVRAKSWALSVST
jgi:hypothetical protein